MEAYEKFQEAILKATREVINPLLENQREEYNEVIKNHLFNEEGPTAIEKNLTKDEIVFNKIFRGFTEISDSFNNLKDICIYVGRFPYGGTKISKTRYLAYNFENYFHEVYILKERLKAYLTTIGRQYKRDKCHPEVLKATRPIFKMVSEVFKNVVDIRSAHVHQKRFNEFGLDRLSTLEMLSYMGDEQEIFEEYYNMEYREKRSEIKKTIKKNNKETKLLLNEYFKNIHPIIFDEEENFKYPKETP